MILNTKIGVYGFFGDLGLRDTFQERVAPKPLQINQDNLHIKFSGLKVDFNGLSIDPYV